MFLKVAGSIVLLVCAALAVIAVISLMDSSKIGRMMSLASQGTDQPFEASDWQHHWQLTNGLVLVSSLAGGVAGLGLLARRRWAPGLLAAVVTASLAISATLNLAGYAKYRFEVLRPAEIGASTALAVALWFGYLKMRDHDPAVGSAL